MKYFIFSAYGIGLPIAYRLQQEGHDVLVGEVHDLSDLDSQYEAKSEPESEFTKTRRLSLYNGMVKKIPAWNLVEQIKQLKSYKDCFVFFESNYLFPFSQALQHVDIHGYFPTEDDYVLEQDRNHAKEFVKKYYPKLQVAPVKEFTSVDDAIAFLHNTNKLWVAKPRNDELKTYVPTTGNSEHAARQLISLLEMEKEGYEKQGFILEEKIDQVIELTPGKMYYDGKPIAILLNIENKYFGSGNISTQVPCAQDLIFPLSFDDKIHEIAFPPIADKLAKKHKGLFYWDASLLIDAKSGSIYFGEFCPNRPGYNQIFTEFEQCKTTSHYFESVMQGKSSFVEKTVGVSVTIFNQEKNPDEEYHTTRDIPIDYDGADEKHFWPYDMYKKKGKKVTAGLDAALTIVTGSGTSLQQAVDTAYENVEKLSFMGAYWRPKFDYVSRDYPTSILNRLEYGVKNGLYKIPFDL